MENGTLFNKDKTILYIYFSKEEKDEYKIPNSVKIIKTNTFQNSLLKSITISQSVSKIEELTFCSRGLISINFENSRNLLKKFYLVHSRIVFLLKESFYMII